MCRKYVRWAVPVTHLIQHAVMPHKMTPLLARVFQAATSWEFPARLIPPQLTRRSEVICKQLTWHTDGVTFGASWTAGILCTCSSPDTTTHLWLITLYILYNKFSTILICYTTELQERLYKPCSTDQGALVPESRTSYQWCCHHHRTPRGPSHIWFRLPCCHMRWNCLQCFVHIRQRKLPKHCL